jgi:hypothetical protein
MSHVTGHSQILLGRLLVLGTKINGPFVRWIYECRSRQIPAIAVTVTALLRVPNTPIWMPCSLHTEAILDSMIIR